MLMAFQKNERGIQAMITSLGMVADMRRRAEAVAALARTTAPKRTGRFAASIQVTSGIRPASEDPPKMRRGRKRRARAVGRVYSDHPRALDIELGTEKTKGHHTLRGALRAAGGD